MKYGMTCVDRGGSAGGGAFKHIQRAVSVYEVPVAVLIGTAATRNKAQELVGPYASRMGSIQFYERMPRQNYPCLWRELRIDRWCTAVRSRRELSVHSSQRTEYHLRTRTIYRLRILCRRRTANTFPRGKNDTFWDIRPTLNLPLL